MNLDPFLQLARHRQVNNTIILTFADFEYRPLLLNWLVAIHRLALSNYVVVALDARLHDWLCDRGIPSFFLPVGNDLAQLGATRAAYYHEVCRYGLDVIGSDVDAIWLRNPIPAFFLQQPCHVVASQGTVWPPDVLDKQNFVFCSGFFYARSSSQTLAFFDDMIEVLRTTDSDQLAFNRVVESSDVSWSFDRSSVYYLRYPGPTVCDGRAEARTGARFMCSQTVIEGESQSRQLRFGLLPHHLFQRLPVDVADAYVRHLLTPGPKVAETRLAMLEASRLLFLRPDWQDVDFDVDTLHKLARSSHASRDEPSARVHTPETIAVAAD